MQPIIAEIKVTSCSLLLLLNIKNVRFWFSALIYLNEHQSKFRTQEQQNVMIAQLYEDTNENPLAGCIIPFLQIPIFIGPLSPLMYNSL